MNYPVSILKNTLLASLTLITLAACTGGTKSSSSSPAESPKTKFELETEELNKATSAGCIIKDTDVLCEEPVISETDDRMEQLNRYKARLDKQAETLKTLQNALSKKINSKTLTLQQEADAIVLNARLAVLESELLVRSSQKQVEIVNETLYSVVMGFECRGSFKNSKGDQLIKESIESNKKDVLIPFNEVADKDLRGELRYKLEKNKIGWSAAESLAGSDARVLRHIIQTDGEFALKTYASSNLFLNCTKKRADQSEVRFTDRPVFRRYLTCQAVHSTPSPGRSDNLLANMTTSFNVSVTDKNKVTDFSYRDPEDMEKLGGNVPDAKFGVKAISNEGVIRYVIYDTVTKNPVIEGTTSNSTHNFMMRAETKAGDILQLTCGDEVNNGKGNTK